MFCPSCGKDVPDGAAYCPACGAQAAASSGASMPLSGFDALTKDRRAQEYWFERLLAYVVDAIIIFVTLAIIGTIVAFPFFFTGFSFGFAYGRFALLGGLVFVLYFALMESSSGATFGKRFFHLKVASKTGANPALGEAFVRNLSKFYPLLLLLDVITGLAVSKGYQQRFSDHFLGTSVVRA